jgi:hypothetical protein
MYLVKPRVTLSMGSFNPLTLLSSLTLGKRSSPYLEISYIGFKFELNRRNQVINCSLINMGAFGLHDIIFV